MKFRLWRISRGSKYALCHFCFCAVVFFAIFPRHLTIGPDPNDWILLFLIFPFGWLSCALFYFFDIQVGEHSTASLAIPIVVMAVNSYCCGYTISTIQRLRQRRTPEFESVLPGAPVKKDHQMPPDPLSPNQ